jgi:hypothetical protein
VKELWEARERDLLEFSKVWEFSTGFWARFSGSRKRRRSNRPSALHSTGQRIWTHWQARRIPKVGLYALRWRTSGK